MRNKITKIVLLLTALVASTCFVSCYKIVRTQAPKNIEAGKTFEGRIVLADDGSINQQEKKTWSLFAVRVPEGWTVSVPDDCYESYAEDWVYFTSGNPVSFKSNMTYSANMSRIYNESNPKAGYKWVAFVTPKQVEGYMAACWRNGCDSVAINFNVTTDKIAGTYTLDYIVGDDESEAGVEAYSNRESCSSTRLYHVGTEATNVEKAQNEWQSTITVTEASGINNVIADVKDYRYGVYTLDGHLLRNDNNIDGLAPGIYIVGGKKTLVK